MAGSRTRMVLDRVVWDNTHIHCWPSSHMKGLPGMKGIGFTSSPTKKAAACSELWRGADERGPTEYQRNDRGAFTTGSAKATLVVTDTESRSTIDGNNRIDSSSRNMIETAHLHHHPSTSVVVQLLPDEASASSSFSPAESSATNTAMRPFSKNKTTKSSSSTSSTPTTAATAPPLLRHRSLPPRPPTPLSTTPSIYIEKTDFPVVQNSTDDDLSFADFSGCDDTDYEEYDAYYNSTNNTYQQQHSGGKSTSLSGFLEDGSHYNNGPQGGGSHNHTAYGNNHSNGPHHPTAAAPSPPTLSLRRRNKVCAVDVASVGNASDTLISVHDHHSDDSSSSQHQKYHQDNHHRQQQHVSGRDLHETAKIAFNAGQYKKALPLFESILASQARRFTWYHPSVGAALHNVGVRTLSLFVSLWICESLPIHPQHSLSSFSLLLFSFFPCPGLSATHGGK
jgi:hypothetical protein